MDYMGKELIKTCEFLCFLSTVQQNISPGKMTSLIFLELGTQSHHILMSLFFDTYNSSLVNVMSVSASPKFLSDF